MQDFIDLHGASGAAYRFRRLAEGASHQPIAGNYAFVKETANGYSVVRVGMTTDLSKAREECPASQRRGAGHLFTRLNVARLTREAEHADLAAAYPPVSEESDA